MIEEDFVQICCDDRGCDKHFKAMAEELKFEKRSSEWKVSLKEFEEEAIKQFVDFAQWYKDQGRFGEVPSSIAIEIQIAKDFEPFFKKQSLKSRL